MIIIFGIKWLALSCCSLENPIKFNRIVPVLFAFAVYMTIDSIKLITLLMRRARKRGAEPQREEEEEKIVSTGRDALT